MLFTGSKVEHEELNLLVSRVGGISDDGLLIMMEKGGVGILVKENLCENVVEV